MTMKMAFSETSFLERKCRACLSKEESDEELLNGTQMFQSIFEFPKNNQEMSIAQMLSITVPQLVIESTDEFSKQICSCCVDKLINAHHFQEMCLRSDSQMRGLVETENLNDTKFSNEVDTTPRDHVSIFADPLLNAELLDNNENVGTMEEIKDFLKLELHDDKDTSDDDVYAVDTTEEVEEVNDKSTNAVNENNEDVMTNDNVTKIPSEQEAAIIADTEIKNEKETRLTTSDYNEQKDWNGHSFENEIKIEQSNDRSKALPQRFECPLCHLNFATQSGVSRHKRRVHKESEETVKEELLIEEKCDATDSTGLQMSLLGTSVDQTMECKECCKQFNSKSALKKHKSTHSKKKEKKSPETKDLKQFPCEICNVMFRTLISLMKHRYTVHQEQSRNDANLPQFDPLKPYVCEYCNKAFQQSSTLKDHVRTHTGEQPFLCSECGKAFNSSSNMRQHLLRHTGVKRYECPDCPKKFPCLSDLASHRAVHKKIKPHICDTCGARFGKPYQLKKHKMYHNGEKPHKCEYCEMRFVCADHMRRHMRTHTGEKPYKCKYCERAFAQSNDLIKHLRSHLGENVYKCELCPRGFRLATELREHFVVHKNEDDETRQQNLKALLQEEINLKSNLPVKIRQSLSVNNNEQDNDSRIIAISNHKQLVNH